MVVARWISTSGACTKSRLRDRVWQVPHNTGKGRELDPQAIDSLASRLQELNQRLHMMITQASLQEHFDPPPQSTEQHMVGRPDLQVQAYLGYMSQGLDAMEAAQARYNGAIQQSIYDTEEQLEDVNIRLHDMLQRTNSVGHSPVLPDDEPRGKDLQSQLAFSSSVLERLNKRIETLVEQKDILTRQIQQQRELNSKSDAERDAKIHELMAELEEARNLQAIDEKEAQNSRDQINLLMEQLDTAKQENVLIEQERGVSTSKAVELEQSARKEMEARFVAKQDEHSQLQSRCSSCNYNSPTRQPKQPVLQQTIRKRTSTFRGRSTTSAMRSPRQRKNRPDIVERWQC